MKNSLREEVSIVLRLIYSDVSPACTGRSESYSNRSTDPAVSVSVEHHRIHLKTLWLNSYVRQLVGVSFAPDWKDEQDFPCIV